MSDLILEKKDMVATMILNRPAVRNSLNPELLSRSPNASKI